jgi:trimeric autotransporter adhesin
MKKNLYLLLFLFFISHHLFSQGVGIGTTTPDSSAVLDITTASKGLLIPRMSTTSINSINIPAKGLLVYDSLINQFKVNIGSRTAPNFQTIGPGNAWNIGGNTGINPANQFIGNTDNQPLRFRINNIQAGELHPATGNIFWGLRAGASNTTGFSNTAIGTDALNLNTNKTNLVAIGDSALFHNGQGSTASTDGTSNTALGSKSLFANTTGNTNTAIGSKSLFSNTSGNNNTAAGALTLSANTAGFQNTAIGNFALQSNTTGSDLTAIGVDALFANTTGFVNTAIGFAALFSNTTGSFNTANGEFSMHDNTTGSGNTAVGNFALQFNTTGGNNSAFGINALFLNKTGFQNTALGNFSLKNNTTGHDNIAAGVNALINDTSGSSNTALGNFAGDLAKTDNNNTFIGFGANNTSGIALSNSTALGFGAAITASNQVRFGNASTTSIGGVVGYTTLSDGRLKQNIQDNVKGIDFIMKLHPVTYQLNLNALNKKLNSTKQVNDFYKNVSNENSNTIFSGFIAQEVEQAAKESGYNFSGIDKPKNENDFYGLRYTDFVVPLVKAVQQQQQMIEALQKNNADQTSINENLLKTLKQLEDFFITKNKSDK